MNLERLKKLNKVLDKWDLALHGLSPTVTSNLLRENCGDCSDKNMHKEVQELINSFYNNERTEYELLENLNNYMKIKELPEEIKNKDLSRIMHNPILSMERESVYLNLYMSNRLVSWLEEIQNIISDSPLDKSMLFFLLDSEKVVCFEDRVKDIRKPSINSLINSCIFYTQGKNGIDSSSLEIFQKVVTYLELSKEELEYNNNVQLWVNEYLIKKDNL